MTGDPVMDLIFASEGGVRLHWERATRCTCYSDDTKQPQWGHTLCGGYGANYAPPVEIRGLYRSRSAWTNRESFGENILGQAQLTTAGRDLPSTPACQPGWIDDRVRDRFTVLDAVADTAPGTIFYPSTRAVPFLFAGVGEAWRVQLSGADQATRLKPQP